MRIAQRSYFTLLASLPQVPYFEQAERLPINPERLQDRLGLLEVDDAGTADQAADLLAWERQPPERTDAEVVANYRRFRDRASSRLLQDMVEFRLARRTILAALRRKNLGLPAPVADEPWGSGEWRAVIVRNWDTAGFGLEPRFPWISDARKLIANRQGLALERLLIEGEWRWLDQRGVDDDFSFDAVLVYLFRWNIVARWLSQDRPAAKRRFKNLALEVTGEHEHLFA